MPKSKSLFLKRTSRTQKKTTEIPEDAVRSSFICINPRQTDKSSRRLTEGYHRTNQQLRFVQQDHNEGKQEDLHHGQQQRSTLLREEPHKQRSALHQAEEELHKRLDQLSHENQQLRAALEQKDKELRQSIKRIRNMEKDLRSAQQKEKDLNKRLDQLSLEKQQLRTAVDLKEKENEKRLNQLSHENKQLSSALDQNIKVLNKRHPREQNENFRRSRKSRGTSSCQRCEHQAQEHRQTMAEMETFYKDKLTEARSALKEKDEELRSFKDRVAENVVLSLKTDNTENMNSPVNQSRLTEMYQQLRVCTWPNIHFTSSDEEARKLVQEMFAAAAEHMKTSMKTVSGLKSLSPKVEKFTQTALENLQLALYHSSKQDVFQAAFQKFKGGPAELQLASECYWLGCLMALHTPPLHPHWDRTDAENWEVFPRDITSERRLRNRETHL